MGWEQLLYDPQNPGDVPPPESISPNTVRRITTDSGGRGTVFVDFIDPDWPSVAYPKSDAAHALLKRYREDMLSAATAPPPAGVKWTLDSDYGYILSHKGWIVARTDLPIGLGMVLSCINACAGMTDPETEVKQLRSALSALRSRMDLRKGDTDPDDPDLVAMRAASAALDGVRPDDAGR